MKKFLMRTAKLIGAFVILTFISAFVWANWEAPGPGAKADVVDFVQYDASKIGDSLKVAKIQKTLKKQAGVHGSTYNSQSNLLVMSYGVSETDRETIESAINQTHNIKLKEKNFTQTGPKCPINVAYITRVKHFLCIRD